MKKILSLTIIAIIALIGLTVSVNAAETQMTASEFLADLADGKMSSDVELTEQVVVNKDMTFDLDGHTLKMTEKANISVQKGELTVKNGTVVAVGYAFRVEASEGNAILNIESDVEATAGACAVFIKKPGSVLNTEGDLTATGGFATISGNGNLENGGVEVNIIGGSVTHESYAAVYFPNTTTLNIKDGIIRGTSAVYHKSGKLNVSGGKLIATGAKVDYKHKGDGCAPTGDTLVIEACDYPGGVPVVSITGGTFTSKNNKAIGYYSQDEAKYKLANEKFITGGVFSSDISDNVAEGYVVNPVYTYDVDMYEVKMNRPYVTQDAVDSSDGEIEMGLVSELQGELEEIFEKEIDKNEKLKEALLAGKSVNIQVQMEKLEEKAIKEEELKAIKESAKEGKIINFYDITLEMIADRQEKIGTISEISGKLKFKVLVPEELIKENREFFMYRYHDGKVEKIEGELDKENYFVFETDKFSTYALAYEDITGMGSAVEEPAKDETPKTGAFDIVLYVLGAIALVSLVGTVKAKKPGKYSK